jgi:hypothetical protein
MFGPCPKPRRRPKRDPCQRLDIFIVAYYSTHQERRLGSTGSDQIVSYGTPLLEGGLPHLASPRNVELAGTVLILAVDSAPY